MKKPLAKKKLIIIIACVVAVVIAAAVTVTLLLIRNSEETVAGTADNKIYWNINRLTYFGQGDNGYTSRERNKDDGYYHILFTVDGRPTERKVQSLQVATKIDDNYAMGLVIDEKTRAITDIVPLEEISGGYLYKNVFVKSIDPEKFEITANTSKTFAGEEVTIKLKSTTLICDVSSQALFDAGMPVKFESLEEKDTITVIANKDGSIQGVYIVKRNAKIKVYWNITRQYDRTKSETKRTPDKNGVYHIDMAMGGQEYDILCKDKVLVGKIDNSVACGLRFDEEGYAVEWLHVNRCTGGRSVTSWWGVDAIGDKTYTATKYILGAKDTGQTGTYNLSSDCEIYNVSKNYEKFPGEVTELKVTDTVQGFTDASGKVVLLYVVTRWKDGDVYWNPYRMWNSTKQQSSRKLSDDGYYHVLLCSNGQSVDYKVASKAVIDKLDGIAVRTFGITLQNGIIVDCTEATNIYYASKASWYTVDSFKKDNKVHLVKYSSGADNGRNTNIQLADDCVVYNVSELYDDHIGEKTTLRAGDVIQGWADYTQKVKIIFVISRKAENPVTPHKTAHSCADCGKNVTWTPWTSATSLPSTSGHYYLCGDVVSKQTSIKNGQNVVLCLNGYSVRAASSRIYATFEVGTKLTIHDCTGKGKMYSKYQGDYSTTQGGIIWARFGTVNLIGGTYIAPTQDVPGNGAVICSGGATTVNIKNATIIGGNTYKNGGALFIGANAKLSLENTTIKSGHAATGRGDGIFVSAKSTVDLAGKVVINGSKSNLYLANGAYINFKDGLKSGSNIKVSTATADGKISTNYYQDVEKYFVSENTALNVNATPNALYLSKNYTVTEHKNTHTCEECGESVSWTPWTMATSLPTASGHYYLCGDVTVTAQQNILKGENVVLCLNGYSVKSTVGRVYSTFETGSKLSIHDCVGTGKVYSTRASGMTTTQGGLIWARFGEVNLFGGTYEAPPATTAQGAVICSGTSVKLRIKNADLKGGATESKTGGGVIFMGNESTLELENVELVSGKAGNGLGDAIYAGGKAIIGVAGKVLISDGNNQVYLNNNAFFTLNGTLSEGSYIGVNTVTEGGKFTTNYTSGAENYFASEKVGCTVSNIGNALYLDDGSSEIPAHSNNHSCEECGEDVTWVPWISKSSLPLTSGHYYLCYDVETKSQQSIPENQEIVLCLNGHTVKGTGSRVYVTNATGAKLTLTDCVGSGKIYNAKDSGLESVQGTVLWARYGTINVFGGTYEAPQNATTGNGSVICGGQNTEINIKNATLTGGTSKGYGGAIFMGAGSNLTLENVDITAGTGNKNVADAIYCAENSKITIGGKLVITGGTNQVYLASNVYIHFADNIASGTKFGVNSAAADNRITDNYITDTEKYVVSNKSGCMIKTDGTALYFVSGEAHYDDHACEECDQDVTWTAWTEKAKLPTTSGHYYLCYDVTVTGQQTVKANDVVLCLNGHTVKSTAGRVYVTSSADAKLTILDCVGTGKVLNAKTSGLESTQGTVLWAQAGTINIFGGTFEASSATASQGSVIHGGQKTTINVKNATLIGGPTKNNGAAVFLGANSKASFENVTITSGTSATGVGDAIYVNLNTILTLSGKIAISGGTNQVYLAKGAYLHFADELANGSSLSVNTANDGGKISNNYADGVESYITSDKSGYTVKVQGNALYQVAATTNAVAKNASANNLAVFSPLYNLLKEVAPK